VVLEELPVADVLLVPDDVEVPLVPEEVLAADCRVVPTQPPIPTAAIRIVAAASLRNLVA
jgi:hypothetical protein